MSVLYSIMVRRFSGAFFYWESVGITHVGLMDGD